MLKRNLLYVILLFACLPVLAQQKGKEKTQAVIVVGKVLSASDSMLVKQLFLDGLHSKLIQNPQLAGDYFKRVIDLDPANDAALYELASIFHAKNQGQNAEVYARRAVTIKPEN